MWVFCSYRSVPSAFAVLVVGKRPRHLLGRGGVLKQMLLLWFGIAIAHLVLAGSARFAVGDHVMRGVVLHARLLPGQSGGVHQVFVLVKAPRVLNKLIGCIEIGSQEVVDWQR